MFKILKLKNNTFEEIEVSDRIVKYDELRNAIGGYIEALPYIQELENANIDVWCDEEGKLKQLPIECVILDSNNKVLDSIAGTLVFTSVDKYGNSLSLSENQIEIIKNVIDRDYKECYR